MDTKLPVPTFGYAPQPDVARRGYLDGILKFTILVCGYRILLDVSYAYLDQVFSYQGLFLNKRTAFSNTLSWILLFSCIPAFKRVFDDRTISGNILSVLILFSVIPTITAISYRSDYDTSYIFLQCVYWVVMFVCWSNIDVIRITSLNRIRSERFHFFVLIVLSVSVVVYSYINTGLRLHYDLIEVYDIRAEARTFEAPFPLNYLVSLADNMLPFFAVYALFQRRYAVLFVTLLVIYVNFSVAGTKQIMFTIFLGFSGYFVFRDFGRARFLVVAALALAAISMVQSLYFDSNTLTTLFAYRVLFIPAELHFSYFSYFQVNDILYFNQSILKWLNVGPEQENIQFVLGEYSIGEFSARANNGLFSDAYMNLGGVGMLIFPPLITLYLRILDGSVEGLDPRILFVITLYVSFVLLGMTLTSALLTSGLIFVVFLLYSLPRLSR